MEIVECDKRAKEQGSETDFIKIIPNLKQQGISSLLFFLFHKIC